MPFNNSDIFKCDPHNFSTSDIKEWDKHLLQVEHQHDLHDNCACGCGQPIHVIVSTKLSPAAKRIPRGQMKTECTAKIKAAQHIKEDGEVQREKEKKEK